MMGAYYVLGAVASGFLWDERIFTKSRTGKRSENNSPQRQSITAGALANIPYFASQTFINTGENHEKDTNPQQPYWPFYSFFQ
jgi:hypothetical protein